MLHFLRGQMAKILILEDDDMTMMLYKEILEEEQLEIIGVSHPEAVFDHLSLKPSLIITDMNFPGMSCADLMNKIRLDKENAQTPIIIVSGDENIQKFSQELGATDYLRKPFSLDNFIGMVKKHLP